MWQIVVLECQVQQVCVLETLNPKTQTHSFLELYQTDVLENSTRTLEMLFEMFALQTVFDIDNSRLFYLALQNQYSNLSYCYLATPL